MVRRRDASPSVLVAAGLDPSGGAGLAADVEALLAVGARALPVATALTVQGPRGALGFEPVAARRVAAQVDGLRGAPVGAVKVGMLGSAANALALARAIEKAGFGGAPLVVDPVLASSSGLSLLLDPRGRGPAAILAPLLDRATLATPNLAELELLAGAPLRTDDERVAAARALGCEAVLVKGGHRRGPPTDLLVTRAGVVRVEGTRRRGTARGTGCRLASAVAGLLARGEGLERSVREAKRVVEAYLDRFNV